MFIESLNYPFDTKTILRKRRSIRKELSLQKDLKDIKVALLGGSTTSDILNFVEIFLLNAGLRPTFFESEYGKYFEDVVVDDSELRAFKPDIVFIHTTHVNLINVPDLFSSDTEVESCLRAEMEHYESIWGKLSEEFDCLIIQNNFDLPFLRSLGNLDSTEIYGKTNFLNRLNLEFSSAARQNPKLIINDINYLSFQVGLNQWHDPNYWFSYKMAVTQLGSIYLGHSIVKLIRAAYGKTRRCLVLDLDNVMWGGVIGEDGLEGIKIGQETPQGEAFTAFQEYCKELNERGILLAVCSKNELDNAQGGFSHPDSVLKLDNFTSFWANWDPKPSNIENIASEINIGLDSLVFVDDNPAERFLVSAQLPSVVTPDLGNEVSHFAEFIEREGYFEVTNISRDDVKRAVSYADSQQRAKYKTKFADYNEFLESLEMKAEIGTFSAIYLDRITQLANKTNQFNLTTKRYTFAEIQAMAESPEYITLYGRLEDRFGDNGLITVVAGRLNENQMHIDLWFMSCRVIKRDMELAMLDALVLKAVENGSEELIGYYYQTQKNGMVVDHYSKLGFKLVSEAEDQSSSVWKLELKNYETRNKNIKEIEYV